MDSNQIRQIIKNLNIELRCPRCQKIYNLDEIFLKRIVGSTYFLQLNCSNCQNPMQASISLSGNMMPKTNKQTQPQQPQRPINQPITNDDLIDFHNFLEKNNRKITDLI
jgi:hypothetical protein